jgi:periplasmic protein TonB
MARRAVRPLSPVQTALDPFDRGRRAAKAVRSSSSLAVSIAIHAAVVVIGLWAGRGRDSDRPADRLTRIEVRQRPHQPPPESPQAQAPEPAAQARTEIAETQPEPRPRPRPQPTTAPPPSEPPPKKPPPRVVGLSLDSTTQGGGGPSFAVGNSRLGQTAARAADPNTVQPGGTGPATAEPTAPPAGPNQVATHIPTAAGNVVLPKRQTPAALPYPDTLKRQGIAADVTVIVKLDPSGKVKSVTIAKSSGYLEFDAVARQAAMNEQFAPATRDGQPIPYTLSFTYRFRLEEEQ